MEQCRMAAKKLLWRPQTLWFGRSASSTEVLNCTISLCCTIQMKYGKVMEQYGEKKHKALSLCFFHQLPV